MALSDSEKPRTELSRPSEAMIAPPGTPGAATIVTPSMAMKDANIIVSNGMPWTIIRATAQATIFNVEPDMWMVAHSGMTNPATSGRTLERHRNCGGRRLRAQCGGICRKHCPEAAERILAREYRSDAVLGDEQPYMHHEYDCDNLDERHQHRAHGAGGSHVEEDTEDVYRQQRNDESAYGELNHIAEITQQMTEGFGCVGENGAAETKQERQHKCRHDRHERFHRDGEVGQRRIVGHVGGIGYDCVSDQRGEYGVGYGVRHHSGTERHDVRYQHCHAEHGACAASYVGDCRSHESDYQERDYETEQRAENGGESGEYAA